jgi:hypothetical protein
MFKVMAQAFCTALHTACRLPRRPCVQPSHHVSFDLLVQVAAKQRREAAEEEHRRQAAQQGMGGLRDYRGGGPLSSRGWGGYPGGGGYDDRGGRGRALW